MKKKNAVSCSAKGFGRREFAQRAALALTGAALAGMPLSDFAATTGSGLAKQREDAQGLSANARAEIESKLQHIFATYGSRLNEEQRKLMRRTVVYHVRMLEAVRPITVANGDPPATVLKLVQRKTSQKVREADRHFSRFQGATKDLKSQG